MSKKWTSSEYNSGTSIKKVMATVEYNWQAAYGLELMRITAEADHLTELSGEFVEAFYPTEDEFRETRLMNKAGMRRTVGSGRLRITCPEIMGKK